MLKKSFACLIAIILFALCLNTLYAYTPHRYEMLLRDAWINKYFKPVRNVDLKSISPQQQESGLVVISNHGDILYNGRPDGRPLKIGNIEYKTGLLCHAPSKIQIFLPSAGAKFTAVAGVDANAGGGSVVFTVKIGNKELFRSDVLKGSEAGVPIDANLNGAESFTIIAEDAGDGIACDHADWADAKITLANGGEIMLSDMSKITRKLYNKITDAPPFSFVYNGQMSDEFLGTWKSNLLESRIDEGRMRRVQTFLDPRTGLEVRCDAVIYTGFPTIEWTVYFKNTGSQDTPILKDIQGLDCVFEPQGSGDYLLRHFIGSRCEEQDFRPIDTPLLPNISKRITGARGRPTSEDLCYFNIDMPNDKGLILGLGWPGQWASEFNLDSSGKLRIVSGQEMTNLKLHPGEEIRTPLIVMQFRQGEDWIESQNIWRKWMKEYNMPDHDGKPLLPQYDGCGGNPLPFAEEEIALIEGYIKDGLMPDPWIIDAGWYVNNGSWTDTGTWEVDKKRFPKGLKEVSDTLHKHGLEFVVWFEPERVNAGTWLAEEHPDWVLGGKSGGLLDLGNKDALEWVTNHIDKMLRDEGIDHYRSDYNIDPLSYWSANDADDRTGITENAYIQGFLKFWDELRKRHPGMYIDTCASGGRRNDLETLRRSVPLLRSDWPVLAFTPEGAAGQQSQTHSLSLWLPYHGTGAPSSDIYTLRSAYSPAYRFGYDPRVEGRDKTLVLKSVAEYREIMPYLLADYYPLTPYTLDKDKWIAWQYNSTEEGGGAIQAFRREESTVQSMELKLRGLDTSAEYVVTNLDDGSIYTAAGTKLMNDGIKIDIGEKRGSAIYAYKKKP